MKFALILKNMSYSTIRGKGLGRLASSIALAICLLGSWNRAQGQDFSAQLSDKVFHGSGTINLMRDLSAAQIAQYFGSGGDLNLGVDLNESATGNESRDSVGVAIKSAELTIATSAGTYSFNDFYTSTTALITEAGAGTAEQFHTLFGTIGSSQINGGSGFDVSDLDDVLKIRNVQFAGTVQSASIEINFLETEQSGVEGNETFFDFSNGFEDFSILSSADSTAVTAAAIGQGAAPASISFSPASPPAAPAPPLLILAGFAAFALVRRATG